MGAKLKITLHAHFKKVYSVINFKQPVWHNIINPRRACAARVTVFSVCVVVGLCVCLSINQQLFWHYRVRGGP